MKQNCSDKMLPFGKLSIAKGHPLVLKRGLKEITKKSQCSSKTA